MSEDFSQESLDRAAAKMAEGLALGLKMTLKPTRLYIGARDLANLQTSHRQFDRIPYVRRLRVWMRHRQIQKEMRRHPVDDDDDD